MWRAACSRGRRRIEEHWPEFRNTDWDTCTSERGSMGLCEATLENAMGIEKLRVGWDGRTGAASRNIPFG